MSVDVAPLSYLVYLCGVEIPCESVEITYGLWSAPQLVMRVPPDPLLARIGREDLLPVQVFYLDLWAYDAPTWCLIFDGYVTATSRAVTSRGQSMTLYGLGLYDILSMLRLFYLQNLSNIVEYGVQTTDDATPTAQAEAIFPAGLLYLGLDPGGTPISRPIDLWRNCMEALVGYGVASADLLERYGDQIVGDAQDVQDLANDTQGVRANLFKSAMALHWAAPLFRRREFLERFVPSPLLESGDAGAVFPTLEALQKDAAIGALTKIVAQIGDAGTVFDLLRSVYQRMFWELVSIPAPPLVSVELPSGDIIGGPRPGAHHRLAEMVSKPTCFFGAVPMCNVCVPQLHQELVAQEDYRQPPSRLLLSDGSLFHVLGTQGNADLQRVFNVALATAHPAQAQEVLDLRLGRGGQAADPAVNPHNFIVHPVERYRGPLTAMEPLPPWFIYLQASQGGELGPDDEQAIGQIKQRVLDHLAAIPPGGPQAQEVERLYNAVNSAPETLGTAASGTTPLGLLSTWNDVLGRLTNPPEGIPPLPDAEGLLQDIATRTGRYVGDAAVRQRWAAQLYAQRVYQHRSGAQSMVFNPYIVTGFPSLHMGPVDVGLHVVGYIVSVTHRLGKQGGGTSVSYSMGRTLEEVWEEMVRAKTGADRPQTAEPLASAPPEPIEEVRRVLQHGPEAQRYFARLLWHDDGTKPRVVSLTRDLQAQLLDAQESQGYQDLTELALDNFSDHRVRFAPKPGGVLDAKGTFDALRRASRPVCTLAQWLLLHKHKAPAKLQWIEADPAGRGPRYPLMILDLVPGPGPAGDISAQGNVNNLNEHDTRLDWALRLLQYRARYYNTKAPRRA